MPFYKDNQKAILYKDNYEPANAYGPGGSYAVKYENILNPVAVGYGSANERFEALGDGSFKVTRVNASTSGWEYGIYFNKNYTLQLNHKYYFQIDCYVSRLPSSITTLAVEAYYNSQWTFPTLPTATNEWQTLGKITSKEEIIQAQLRNRILIWHVMLDSQGFQNGDYYMVRRPIFIDLTDAFGSGYEPTTQQELYAALPQLANGGYMPPTKATTLEHTYIPTKVPTAYWIGENCNVHWNMINGNNCVSSTHQGITYTNNQNGSWTINGTSTGYSFKNIKSDLLKWLRNSHKYLIYCKGLKDTYTDDDGLGLRVLTSPDTTFGKRMINTDYYIFTTPTDMESLGTNDIFRWCTGTAGHTYDNVTLWPQLFDLTEMFGAGYEPTIDEFKAMYPNDYYPYDESYSPYTSVGNRITAYKGNNYVNFRNQAITVTATTKYGVTITKNADGSMNIHGTCTESPTYRQFTITRDDIIRRDGSKYLYRFNKGITVTDPATAEDGKFGVNGYGPKSRGSFIFSVESTSTWAGNVHIYLSAGTTIDVDNLFVETFCLTDMFGKGKEPTIEQFNLLFPNTYYKYTDSTYIRDVKGYDTQLTIPGGPLYFNQINKSNWASSAEGGVTYTNNSDGSWTINGTCTATARGNIMWTSGSTFLKNNHVYLVYCKGLFNHSHDPSDLGLRLLTSPDSTFSKVFAQDDYFVFTAPSNIESLTGHLFRWCVSNVGSTFDNVKLYPHLIDLTAMYGYGNEPTLAQCRQLFTGLYYPYTTSKLIPAQVRKDLYRVNFNQIITTSGSSESTKCGITLTRTWVNNSIICTATGTATAWTGDPNWYLNCRTDLIQNHKYYVRFNGGNLASMYLYNGWTTHPVCNSLGTIVTASATTAAETDCVTVRFAEYAPEGTVVNETFTVEVIDLTQTFGAGKEPDNVYILNELFGHTFLPYTTSMWVDSPNNIITETPSQITKMLAGYRTVQKQGYEISVDGTYNDPFVCTYYPEQSTQLTSTGANKVDLVNHAGEEGLQIMPDGRFKWTQSPTSGGRFLGFFTNPDGSYVSLAAGQTLTTSCIVDDIVLSGEVNYICGLIYYNNDGTYSYIGAISSDTSLIGQWQSKSSTTQKAVDKIRLYFTNASGTQPTDYVIFKDFQLEIDTNVGQYEPYTSQLPAPTPTNMLPISYNKSQKIVLDTDATHSTYNFPITSDAKLIWKPSDYSTDFEYMIYQEGTRMKKRSGTDYVQYVPLVAKSSATPDTAWDMATTSYISLDANKIYSLVFKFKKVNCILSGLPTGTVRYSCNIIPQSGNPVGSMEYCNLNSGQYSNDNAYAEGWTWVRYKPITTGNYKVRIGADYPNTNKIIEDRGSYIQFTDIALYEGELPYPYTSVTNLQAVLSDGNKQTIVSNKELGYVTRAGYAFQPNTLQPYVKDTNNEWKSCLTQNTYTITYKGDESWYARPNTSHSFQCNAHGFNVNGGFCTHFVPFDTSSQIDVQDGVYLSYSYTIIITNMSCNSLDEFKAFLAAEYNKGTPVTIVCGREYGVSDIKTYNNPLLAHTLPYHTDINTDAEYVTAYIKESL